MYNDHSGGLSTPLEPGSSTQAPALKQQVDAILSKPLSGDLAILAKYIKRLEGRNEPPPGVERDLWNEFLKTRTKLKAPNTPRALNALTKRLALYVAQGCDANELVEEANSNGWKTVYNKGETKVKPRETGVCPKCRGSKYSLIHQEVCCGKVT